MCGWLNRRRRRRGREDGITMVAVLVALTIILVVVLGSLAYLSSSTKYSRYEQDNDLALAAAQSGISELLSRLRTNPDYLTNVYDTRADPKSYCNSPGVGGPISEGDHFRVDCEWPDSTDINWASVSGDASAGAQKYHLVITDFVAMAESLEVVSTGKSQNVVRSVKARLARASSPMFLYLSDYELVDPTDYTAYPIGTGATWATCGQNWQVGDDDTGDLGYAWEIKAGDKPARYYVDKNGFLHRCSQPAFERWDTLEGPVHSNDTIKSNGATFSGEFSSANEDCRNLVVPGDSSTYDNCIDGTATFSGSGPFYQSRQLVQKTPDSNLIGAQGCQYQGPTRIVFNGDGTMTVWSKLTTAEMWKQPQLDLSDAEIGDKLNKCGAIDALQSDVGATVDIPNNDIIYVRQVWADSLSAAQKALLGSTVASRYVDGRLPLGSYTGCAPSATCLGYQIEAAMEQDKRKYENGNLWLDGEARGVVTVYADHTIVITGDLLTEDNNTDLLGLMAGGSIEVYNPVLVTYGTAATGTDYIWTDPTPGERANASTWGSWPRNIPGTDNDGQSGLVVRIEAAMIAGTGSFRLQNWKIGGDLGTIEVYGSIAQHFRGVVAWEEALVLGEAPTLLSGYRKHYIYNTNLTTSRPLLFAPLTNGVWEIWWQEKVEPSEAVQP